MSYTWEQRAEYMREERDAALAEVDRLREALAGLAGDCGCVLREPADVSQPPREVEACRDQHPDKPYMWCYACFASAALAPETTGKLEPS